MADTPIAMGNAPTPVLGGSRAWLVWALAVTFVIWLFNIQTGYAILNNSVAKTLNLQLDQVGMIAAVYTWTFAIAQLFSGALLDRLGSRRVLAPAIALVTVGVFLFSYAQSFEILLLSQFVIALGSCAGFVGAGYVGGVWFGMAKFGFMFGLVQVFAALSSAFGQPAFDLALGSWDWRTVIFGFGIFGIGLFICALLFIRNPTPVARSSQTLLGFVKTVLASIAEVLSKAQILVIALQGGITFGMVLAMGVVWGPKLLVAHGLTDNAAYYATACIWLGLAVGSALINKISDRLHSRKIPILATTLIQLAALAAAVYLPLNAGLAMVIYFVLGLANSGHMLNFTAAGDIVPPRLIGTSASVVNGTMFVLGGILIGIPGRRLAGTAADLPAYQSALGALMLAVTIAVVLALFIKESYPKAPAQ